MKILGTGLTGLVGERVVKLLSDTYEFEQSYDDITDKIGISKKIETSDADCVLHLAAKTNVDGCEEDKNKGIEGAAWKVNVIGTKNVTDACSSSNKKLIYISTDFVFDGEKKDKYYEEDTPNPINWYAKTKYEGEKIIQSTNLDWIIARIAYPYRANFKRMDFARKLKDLLQNGQEIKAVYDQTITPTFIDDIANALKVLIENKEKGIFHVVGSQPLSPYDAAVLIADVFDSPKAKISKIEREKFFKNRAPRPFNLSLGNDKIQRLGIKMKTFEEGLKEIRKQIS